MRCGGEPIAKTNTLLIMLCFDNYVFKLPDKILTDFTIDIPFVTPFYLLLFSCYLILKQGKPFLDTIYVSSQGQEHLKLLKVYNMQGPVMLPLEEFVRRKYELKKKNIFVLSSPCI